MNLSENEIKMLLKEAHEARKNSYSPYSNFAVGAALLDKEGKIWRGCNIENASYGATNCAERTALFKAVSEGEKEFRAIAIVGGPKAGKTVFCTPCGICRQALAEFCKADEFSIILEENDGTSKLYTLAELLPLNFAL